MTTDPSNYWLFADLVGLPIAGWIYLWIYQRKHGKVPHQKLTDSIIDTVKLFLPKKSSK